MLTSNGVTTALDSAAFPIICCSSDPSGVTEPASGEPRRLTCFRPKPGPLIELTRRFGRGQNHWVGMRPVTMPEKRTSWVNSVSLEREGESLPERPGESDNPVPRVRVVTRLREQVTPEKEEQGSGEVKSQVEKKAAAVVPEGMSARESLISCNAARSAVLIGGRSGFVEELWSRSSSAREERYEEYGDCEVYLPLIHEGSVEFMWAQ
ncbi:unnamed protein product [Ilex paraguariensis]|uniref:Uncharacterized protein n=1 Tax=Ilex paraguariensis TaxID=185542 RepID=A0ABC8TFC3_9AQUA